MMKAKKILIVTHSKDHIGVDKVMAAINARGHQAIRLDTDLFPTEISIALAQDNQHLHYQLQIAGDCYDGSEIDAVWYRRFAPGSALNNMLDKTYLNAAIGESREVLLNFLSNLACFKVDDYWTVRRAAQKELQLSVARQVGLAIPATLVSNDPLQVQAFCREQQAVVAKMLHSFAIFQDKKEHVVFTSEVTASQIDDALRLCPMVFQQKINKARELRVTVVGDQCFCIALHSQRFAGAEVDWRRQGVQLVDSWQIEELPAQVQQQCISVCRALSLNYGAIDIIVDQDGRYVFLEVNPSGEFYWAEQFNQLGITGALADLLIDQNTTTKAVAAA